MFYAFQHYILFIFSQIVSFQGVSQAVRLTMLNYLVA